jgi:hypothetical protein
MVARLVGCITTAAALSLLGWAVLELAQPQPEGQRQRLLAAIDTFR